MHAIFRPGKLAAFGKGEVVGVGMCRGGVCEFHGICSTLSASDCFELCGWRLELFHLQRLSPRQTKCSSLQHSAFSGDRVLFDDVVFGAAPR